MIRTLLTNWGLIAAPPSPGQKNLWFSIMAATPHRRLG